MDKATFAAGCFWGVEEAFRRIDGVSSTAVGYTGGSLDNPSYEQVCNGNSGHAEAVQVEFDPDRVSYEELLDVFWKVHNPTTLNRQGPDIGSQYRSAVFFQNPEQQQAALAFKEKLQADGSYTVPIVTEITSAETFYRAEEYHQQYLAKRGGGGCPIN